MFVYKILTAEEWNAAKDKEYYQGSCLDLKDGFIHLSAKEQVKETLALYFKDHRDLILLSFQTENLVDLRWETSRANLLFPHLYSELPMSKVKQYWHLEVGKGGVSKPPWS